MSQKWQRASNLCHRSRSANVFSSESDALGGHTCPVNVVMAYFGWFAPCATRHTTKANFQSWGTGARFGCRFLSDQRGIPLTMKRRVVLFAAAAAGLCLVPLSALAAPGPPPNTAGENCTATAAADCQFTVSSAATSAHATGYISETTSGTITASGDVPGTTTPCTISVATSPVPSTPTPPSYSLSSDGTMATITGPGAGSLGYVPGCTYTVAVGTGVALEGGTVQ